VKKRLILIIFLALLLGVGSLVYWGQRQERSAQLYYSGTIEAATESNLAFQVSGRVTEVLVDEGQAVVKNRLLAVLDQDEFRARRDQAQAELVRSQESLKQLEVILELNRSVLPAEVKRAEAAVNALKAQLADQEAGYRDQELEQARLAAEQARATMENARKDKMRFDELYRRGVVAEKDRDAADLKFETASKEYDRAKENFNLVKEGFRKESIETARAKLAEGQATLAQARDNLKKIEASEKDVAVAKAMVQSARAAVDLAEIQLAYTQLRAPFDGIIVSHCRICRVSI
jgi:HlyD family secretion protein